MNQLLFLDFDGVLHTLNGRRFELLPVLAAWLQERPDIGLVVSSSTRVQNGVELLREALGELRSRVVGATPVLNRAPLDGPIRAVRQREIETWLAAAAGQRPAAYAALDDDATLYEKSWPPLVLCNSRTGLRIEHLAAIDQALSTQHI